MILLSLLLVPVVILAGAWFGGRTCRREQRRVAVRLDDRLRWHTRSQKS